MEFNIGDEVIIVKFDMNNFEKIPEYMINHGNIPKCPQKGIVEWVGKNVLAIKYSADDRSMCLGFDKKHVKTIKILNWRGVLN